MLFNSFSFLFGFLPAAMAIYALVAFRCDRWRLQVLLLLSVAFYSYWDWRFAPLLLVSIVLNWLSAELFSRRKLASAITAAIVLNLAVLATFKYFNFFGDTLETILGVSAPRSSLPLPLGISFFTFHHVMYLTDLRRGKAPRLDLTQYGLYIAFFPQVLSGPLVRWHEIINQFQEKPYLRPDALERFERGLMLLVLGLVKKVLIGDPLSEIASPIFAKAATGAVIGFSDAWVGMLAFSFQIYFDFSGYTDMALGIALMFGIVLPTNFNAPYRATSLQDFWRRWHITLSRFLRDYLYIPLGGNRFGLGRQLWALLATMALGGLWHGAAWTFVIWGVLHGVGLAAGVLWRRAGYGMPTVLAWLLTFLFVDAAWIMFRAESFSAALAMYRGLIDVSWIMSVYWRGLARQAFTFLESMAWLDRSYLLLSAAFVMSTLGPTALRLAEVLRLRPLTAMGIALLFVLVIFKLADEGNYQFIYFQF